MNAVFSKDALKGKTALVTGATGGIGRAIAKQFNSLGANLLLTGRKADLLEEIRNELDADGKSGTVATVTADLTEDGGREAVVRQASDSFGGIDILINNAGTFANALLEEVKEEELEWVMKVNFTSVVMLTRKVYEEMKRKGSGKIIQISSLSGMRGWEGGTLYASSKFALNGFTQCLAVEAAKHGVQVNAVAPGFVETDMAKRSIGAKAKRAGLSLEEMWHKMEQGLPTGRLTTPEEVAHAVAFLSIQGIDNMTGTYLRISGGGLLG